MFQDNPISRAASFFRGALVAALIVTGVSFAGAAIGQEKSACLDPVAAQAKIAEANAGAKMTKHLKGAKAAALAKAFGAPFEASDILIYVVDGNVYLAAFVDGCFLELSRQIPLEVFNSMFPGLVSEAK